MASDTKAVSQFSKRHVYALCKLLNWYSNCSLFCCQEKRLDKSSIRTLESESNICLESGSAVD